MKIHREVSLRKSLSSHESQLMNYAPRLFGYDYRLDIEPITCMNKNHKEQTKFISSTPAK